MAYNISLLGNGKQYEAKAAEFSGSPDVINRTAAWTAGTAFTLSAWMKFNTNSTTQQQLLYHSDGSGLNYINAGKLNGGNKLFVGSSNAAFTSRIELRSVADYTDADNWIHILCSMSTNANAGARLHHLYINDASDKNLQTDVGTSFNCLPYNAGRALQVGSNDSISSIYLNGSISEFYLAPEYIDLSVKANRRKFIDSTGRPVSLGADGSRPTGNQPLVYLKGSGSGFNVNSGSLGNFTTTGTLVVPATTPSKP